MKYRLKDKELQRKLDDLSDGDFSVQLQKIEDIVLDALSGPVVHFGGLARVIDDRFRNLAHRFTFRFHKDELEEIPEYNPHTWNEWPGVEPPKDIPLQVELVLFGNKPSEQNRKRDCLTWDKTLECFINDNRTAYSPHQIEKMYFRPWMAPDEEDEE